MGNYKYSVIDSQGYTLRVFSTYKEASEYKFVFGNYSWTIKHIHINKS